MNVIHFVDVIYLVNVTDFVDVIYLVDVIDLVVVINLVDVRGALWIQCLLSGVEVGSVVYFCTETLHDCRHAERSDHLPKLP